MQSITEYVDSESSAAVAELTAPEVRQLLWFLDGAIMNAETRLALRRSWGPCPRHAWGMAEVECELRGGVPFATSVLYADLVAGAAEALARRHLGSPLRRLEPQGECLTCAHREDEHHPAEWVERAETVNRHSRFTPLLVQTWQEAAPRACGACLGGDGPTCRPHLFLGIGETDEVAHSLPRLAARMHAYEKSLTVDGRPVDKRGRAAWLETLGWFAGWRFPAQLVRAHAE